MNEQAIQEQYQHIVSLLEQKRLKEAQIQLEAFLWKCKDWTLHSRLEQAKVSYQYMLQYMRQGINDPERQKCTDSFWLKPGNLPNRHVSVCLMKALLVITTHSTRTKRIWLPATVCLPG